MKLCGLNRRPLLWPERAERATEDSMRLCWRIRDSSLHCAGLKSFSVLLRLELQLAKQIAIQNSKKEMRIPKRPKKLNNKIVIEKPSPEELGGKYIFLWVCSISPAIQIAFPMRIPRPTGEIIYTRYSQNPRKSVSKKCSLENWAESIFLYDCVRYFPPFGLRFQCDFHSRVKASSAHGARKIGANR